MAAVAIGPDGRVVVCHTHVPGWMLGRSLKCAIFEFEMFGVALGVELACELYPKAPIVRLCDNKGAEGAIKETRV